MQLRTIFWKSLLLFFLILTVRDRATQAEGYNITLALLWNQEGTAAMARDLFERKFRPAIVEACPSAPGINKTFVEFTEIVHNRLMNIPATMEKIASLGSCLFAGAHAGVSTVPLYAHANVSTGLAAGSAAARRYPRMQLHQVAPIPFSLVSEGVSRALSLALGVSRLNIILGSGYEAFEVERLAYKFPGSVWFHRLVPGAEFELLNKLQLEQATDFFLASEAMEAEAFLSAAFKVRMLHPNYRWFLFNMLLEEDDNFSGLTIVSKNITSMDFGPIYFAISNGLNTTRAVYLFDLLSVWSVYLKNILCDERDEVNTKVDGLTGSFHLAPNGTVSRLNWFMHFYKGLGEQRERIGNWSSSGDFHFEPAKPRIPTDDVLKQELNMNVFRVVTIVTPPFVQYKKGFENRTDVSLYDRLEGFAMDMCKQILANMSLKSVEVFLQPDNSFGSYDPVEGWGGMVGTLMLNAADMACASMSDTELRRGVIKFTQPIQSYQMSILYSKKDVNPVKLLFEFLSPLHLYTWFALLGSGIASGLVLAVLHRISRNGQRLSLYEAMYIALGTLVQGMKTATPDRPSSQVVTMVFWLFVFLFLIIYVTNYAAKRTLERLQTEIGGLDSLNMQEVYKFGTIFGSVYLEFMKDSLDPVVFSIYKRIAKDPELYQPRNVSQALSMVSTGTFAFIYSAAMNHYYIKTSCGFRVAGSFGQDSARLGLPGTVEYDGLINRIIDDLVASGERDRLYKKYSDPPKSIQPDCAANKSLPYAISYWIPQESEIFNTKDSSLTLSHTLGITVINLAGCLLTLLLATLEMTYRKYRLRLMRLRGTMLKDLSLRMNSANAAAADDETMESNA